MSIRHKLLRISSRDRDNLSDSTADFTINLNNSKELQIARGIIVKQVSIPNTVYNITDANRSFTYEIAGAPTTVQIAVGQYSTNTLITALQTAAAAVGLAITQDATTQRLNFTSTTNIEYLDISSNDMAEVLGIEYGTGSGADVASYSATGLPQLGGVSTAFVYSQTLGEHNLLRTDGGTENIVAIVPITVPFGVVEHYISRHTDIDDVDALDHGGKNHQNFNITIKDSADNILDLNGHHVELILKVYY